MKWEDDGHAIFEGNEAFCIVFSIHSTVGSSTSSNRREYAVNRQAVVIKR